MRYLLAAALFGLAGFTNAPVAGFLDSVFPAPGGEGTRPPPVPDRAPPADPPTRPPAPGPDALPPPADVVPSVSPQGR